MSLAGLFSSPSYWYWEAWTGGYTVPVRKVYARGPMSQYESGARAEYQDLSARFPFVRGMIWNGRYWQSRSEFNHPPPPMAYQVCRVGETCQARSA